MSCTTLLALLNSIALGLSLFNVSLQLRRPVIEFLLEPVARSGLDEDEFIQKTLADNKRAARRWRSRSLQAEILPSLVLRKAQATQLQSLERRRHGPQSSPSLPTWQ